MTETLVGQFPKHIGSTGGLLNSAETEEKYAIVWKSSKEQAFELPTGGAAIMHEGDNLMYFARNFLHYLIYGKFVSHFILNLRPGKILSNLYHAFA